MTRSGRKRTHFHIHTHAFYIMGGTEGQLNKKTEEDRVKKSVVFQFYCRLIENHSRTNCSCRVERMSEVVGHEMGKQSKEKKEKRNISSTLLEKGRQGVAISMRQ